MPGIDNLSQRLPRRLGKLHGEAPNAGIVPKQDCGPKGRVVPLVSHFKSQLIQKRLFTFRRK